MALAAGPPPKLMGPATMSGEPVLPRGLLTVSSVLPAVLHVRRSPILGDDERRLVATTRLMPRTAAGIWKIGGKFSEILRAVRLFVGNWALKPIASQSRRI